jgi:hypothetical protein
MEGTSMQSVSRVFLVSFLLAAPLAPLLGQETAAAGPASCLSDWACGAVRVPLGFDVRAVADDGRYLTLEDGSLWEVDISDRATTASWQAGDFVAVHPISAPRDGYEWLLTRTENVEQRVAVKLIGRRRPTQE